VLQLKAEACLETGETKMGDLGEASHHPPLHPLLPQASVVHPDTTMARFGEKKLYCRRAEGLKHNVILLYGILYSFAPVYF